MQLYIYEHLAIIMVERNGRSDDWIMKQYKQRLITWLKDQNIPPGETKDSITISR
jgi:DNA gyrase inhibitor GyrI